MKVLFCGDVVGKSGRQVLTAVLPDLKQDLQPDLVIVNGENAAHGFGLTPKLFQGFTKMGVDVVTMGNHTFDKADINDLLDSESNLVRPMNYPENTIGHGFCIVEKNGIRVCVAQLLGKVFMRPMEDPFAAIDAFVQKNQKKYDVLIVDFHAEATAEKVGMGYFLDGCAGLVLGTHTHTPTADARILPKGTGFQADVGMCGDYNSVIGMSVASALPRFSGVQQRLIPAEGQGTFCGTFAEIDEKTGLCLSIRPIIIGPHLMNLK